MTRIPVRVLPETLVGRIAAGEVVERPGSVVKELVENSLDAGASRIDVEVERRLGGIIRVSDDGCGIPAAELGLVVERHATNKISSPDDLARIGSLGFRGEGLAAIGAVSRLRVVSRAREEEAGAEVRCEGGVISPVRPAARAPGTMVEVADLFHNTPARRKYLKSEAAELRYVSQLLQAYALANPSVQFTLTVNGRRSMEFPAAADLRERVVQVLGRDRVNRMIPIREEGPDLLLEGFLGAPEDSRTRGTHQVFLVNGRWVASPVLRVAVREAYSDLIPPSRHPEVVLHLHLPPEEVDVNVHPTKREVRLLRERELYPRLIRLVRSQVEGRFPALHLHGETGGGGSADVGGTKNYGLPFPVAPTGGAGLVGEPPSADGEGKEPRVVPFPSGAGAVSQETTGEETPAMASMWQLHETYILAAIEGGLLIIDQHAAHERVLYEQAMKRLEGEPPTSQELLFPLVVDLTHDELSLLLETHAVLEKLGFHLELFGQTTVLVHAIPSGLREWRHGALLRDVLDHVAGLPTNLDVRERVARAVACHGAVKAGQKLSLEEMNALVDQLFATEKPQGDPHGRPVFLRVELSELHRRFGRSG